MADIGIKMKTGNIALHKLYHGDKFYSSFVQQGRKYLTDLMCAFDFCRRRCYTVFLYSNLLFSSGRSPSNVLLCDPTFLFLPFGKLLPDQTSTSQGVIRLDTILKLYLYCKQHLPTSFQASLTSDDWRSAIACHPICTQTCSAP